METAYAQALWHLLEKGISPKKAVGALHEGLVSRGRQALMPRIARAFARIAARDEKRNGMVLSITREKDERSAKRAVKAILAELEVSPSDVAVKVDTSLIGGWRFEGREMLVDASWKKHLLSIYNRATQ